MRRPQFTLKTLMWLMAVVAAFCAGVRVEHARQDIERQDWINTTMHQLELNTRLDKENRSLRRQLHD